MYRLVFAICLLAIAAFATPNCTDYTTAAQYQALGSSGCMVGIHHIKEVSWATSTGVFNDGVHPLQTFVSIPGSQVTITPSLTPNGVGLSFSSSAFNITNWQRIFALFSYTIDPVESDIYEGVRIDMDANSPVAPGFAKLSTTICAGGTLPVCGGGTLIPLTDIIHNGTSSGNVLTANVTFAPTYIVDIDMQLTMAAMGASSQINGVSQTANVVPEPGAALLAGLGLAVLAGIRRIRNS